MLDILDDSTGNLELERFKFKLREIWSRILEETYTEECGSKEEYLEDNALRFADEPQPESEVDNLMCILEELLEPNEDLDSVKGEGKAPTYKGSSLKSNNEKRNIESTTYKAEHISSKTPLDSQTKVKSTSYKHNTGKISPRKDARVIRSFAPMAEEMIDELKDLKLRQNIGRRKMLFRL